MLNIQNFLKFFALATFVTALSSCAEEEQNRLLSYEKGTYLGQADQKLGENQLRDLEVRTSLQSWN